MIKKSKGGTQPNISQEIIKSHVIPLPPLSEQHAIVSYITERIAKIDKLVENVNKEIEALKEYKTTSHQRRSYRSNKSMLTNDTRE